MSNRYTDRIQRRLGITAPPRGWPASAAYGLIVTALLLAFAVIVNRLIGRTIHWDWVTIFGSIALIGIIAGRRLRVL